MSKFKSLIIDVDGTTVPVGRLSEASDEVISAVNKAKEKVTVSVATGRSISVCRNILKILDLTDPCIISAGTTIINPKTEEIIWTAKMSIDTANEILKICGEYPYEIYIGDDGKSLTGQYVTKKDEGVIYILGASLKDSEEIIEKLKEISGVSAIPLQSWLDDKLIDIHITDISATKKFALIELKKILEVKKEEVIVVGDSINDLPLFEEAGFKVAMGNAIPELKDLADYIAPTVEEDGLVDVINKFVL